MADPSTDAHALDEALWALLQGDGRDAIGHLEALPPDKHWLDKAIRYLVQASLMSDTAGAAGVFGGSELATRVLHADTVMGAVMRGLIARFEGDYDDAVRQLVKAVEADAADPWAVACLALVLVEGGVVDDAFVLVQHLRARVDHPFVDRVNGLVEAASKAGPR